MDLKIGLRLSDEQEKKLTLISDSVAARNGALAKALQAEMAKMGANVDGGRMTAVTRLRMEEAQKHMQAALDAAKAILTPEQWNYLPERICTPRGFGANNGQRRVPPAGE